MTHSLLTRVPSDVTIQEVVYMALYNYDMRLLDEKFNTMDEIEIFNALKELRKMIGLIKLEISSIEYFLEEYDSVSFERYKNRHKRQSSKKTRIKFNELEDTHGRRSIITRGLSKSSVFFEFDNFSLRSFIGKGRRTYPDSNLSIDYPKYNFMLNYQSRIDILDKYKLYIANQTEKLHKDSIKKIIDITARVDNLKITNKETESANSNLLENFEKEIRLKMNFHSEKIFRFLNGWLKNGSALLGNLRLKMLSTKGKIVSHKQALMRKKDLVGVIKPVDFEILKTSRNDYLKIIDKKKNHLVNLKNSNGEIAWNLMSNMKNLISIDNTLKSVNKMICQSYKELDALKKEKNLVHNEIIKIKDNLFKLKLQDFVEHAPSISQYIAKKADLQILQKEEKQLKRKNEILNIKLYNTKKRLVFLRKEKGKA